MRCSHCGQSIGVISGVTCPHCDAPFYKGAHRPPTGYLYDMQTSLCYCERAVSGDFTVREVTWFDTLTGASRTCRYPAPPAMRQMPSAKTQHTPVVATSQPGKKRAKGKRILAACLGVILLAGGISIWHFRIYTMLPFWNPGIEGVEISPPSPENLPVFAPLNTYSKPV